MKVKVRCDVCMEVIGILDTETIKLPLMAEMFESPDLWHGFDPPFFPGQTYEHFRCPYGRGHRPFNEEHLIKTELGIFDLTFPIMHCPVCTAIFHDDSQKAEHVKMHARFREYNKISNDAEADLWITNEFMDPAATEAEQKPFQCSQCMYRFAIQADLEKHLERCSKISKTEDDDKEELGTSPEEPYMPVNVKFSEPHRVYWKGNFKYGSTNKEKYKESLENFDRLKCSICHSRFKTSEKLKSHFGIHAIKEGVERKGDY